jgi:hypothetical protein
MGDSLLDTYIKMIPFKFALIAHTTLDSLPFEREYLILEHMLSYIGRNWPNDSGRD